MVERTDAEFVLKFDGAIVDAHGAAPAAVVAAALGAMQRLAHLIGMQHEGRELVHRARAPASVQARYAVMCGVPEQGCLLEPVRIAPLISDLVADQAAERAGQTLKRFFGAVRTQDATAISEAAPDGGYRRLMLTELLNMAPPADSGVTLDILDNKGCLAVSPGAARSYVEIMLRPPRSVDREGVLTGWLNEIDFASRKLLLLETSSQRKLTCLYEEAVEPMLLDNPRELIQVHGTIVRDAEGRPESIQDVRLVQALDLSPCRFDQLFLGNEEVRFDPPLDLIVEFDATTGMLSAADPDLGIDAYGETREILQASVRSELDTLWRFYANADPEVLTEDAVELRSRLITRFKALVPHAT